MKKSILVLACAAMGVAQAQELEPKKLEAQAGVSLGLLESGVYYQIPLNDNQWVLNNELTAVSNMYYNSKDGFNYTPRFVNLSSELRYLYSYESRVKDGDDTTHNSAPYFGVKLRLPFYDIQVNKFVPHYANLTLNYGYQKHIGKDFMFNAYVGGGVAMGFKNQLSAGFTLDLGLGLSYIIW